MRNYPYRSFKSTLREGLVSRGVRANEAQKRADLLEIVAVAQFWAKPMRDGPELGHSWKMVIEAHPIAFWTTVLYAVALQLTEC
jgi:hypothetical protein